MLRADAFATLYLFHPLGKFRLQKGRVPILMYHSVSNAGRETVHPYYQTRTTPDVFAQHMQYLSDHGYSTIGLSETINYLNGLAPEGKLPVAITFDDGFEDFYTNAFPIMNRYGFRPTVYLPTDFIGQSAREFKGSLCMTWDQIRELREVGVEFGSHTVTHPQLNSLKPDKMRYEIQYSKETIEQKLGCAVKSFAYPYAFPETDRGFTEQLRSQLDEAGYENGVSTIIGTAALGSDRFFMERLPANSCDDLRLFRAKLEGGYDWLHPMQHLKKLSRAWIS